MKIQYNKNLGCYTGIARITDKRGNLKRVYTSGYTFFGVITRLSTLAGYKI